MSGALTEEEREGMAAALVEVARMLRDGGPVDGVTLVVTFNNGEQPVHHRRVSSDAVSWYAHTAEVFDAGTALLHADHPGATDSGSEPGA